MQSNPQEGVLTTASLVKVTAAIDCLTPSFGTLHARVVKGRYSATHICRALLTEGAIKNS
jgi:hypothetical protein